MKDLLAEVRAKNERGQLNPRTVAARLFSITFANGQPLPDANLLPEFAATFVAGDDLPAFPSFLVF